MAKIIFKNPNNPMQPQPGVYMWYAKRRRKKIVLYIGRAGGKGTVFVRGTLHRGIGEAQGNALTSKGNTLQTDFIISTVIGFFRKKGWDCIWKHLNNNPSQETALCIKHKPLLQNHNSSKIRSELRLRSRTKKWKANRRIDIKELAKKARRKLDTIINGLYKEYITK